MDTEDNIQNLQSSIEFFNKRSIDIYKEWLDINMRLSKHSSLFLHDHLANFIDKHSSNLGMEKYIYLEKLFNYSLELKLISEARNIFKIFLQEYGRDTKIIRMEAQIFELDAINKALDNYKILIINNQEDRTSLKKYIQLLKSNFTLNHDDMKKYIEMWNEYLKIYMDDYEAWFELSDLYILTLNYTKAIYCLEEVLLSQPNNFEIYTKLGDISCSMNNSDAATCAIKYYSQSVLIKPTPRAFFGISSAVNIFFKYNKSSSSNDVGPLKEKYKNLLKLANVNLTNFYKNSPLKFNLDDFYDIQN